MPIAPFPGCKLFMPVEHYAINNLFTYKIVNYNVLTNSMQASVSNQIYWTSSRESYVCLCSIPMPMYLSIPVLQAKLPLDYVQWKLILLTVSFSHTDIE